MDREEFTSRVLEAEKSMYYTAKSILSNDEDCADAMQNAILKAYENLGALKEEKYFKTWITRILINEAYAILRKNKNTVPYEEYMKEEPDMKGTDYSEMCMEVSKLDEKYRKPFLLHYKEGFSIKEIAGMMKKSEGSVKMRILRARNILKERFMEE